MPTADPVEVVAELKAALSSPGRELEAWCTLAGWLSPAGDAARGFLEQVRRKGLRLELAGHVLQGGDRAAVAVQIHQASGRAAKQVWLLLHSAGHTGWVLEAVTRSTAHAAAFVREELAALVSWQLLPPAPGLQAAVRAALDEAPSGAGLGEATPLVHGLRASGHTLRAGPAVALGLLGRAAAQIDVRGAGRARTLYLWCAAADGGWRVEHMGWAFQLGRLLGEQPEP